VRLDDVLPKASGALAFVDFLLVDCEGFDDVPVLHGARNLIVTRRVGVVVFELHGRDNFNDLYRGLFEANNYRCFLITKYTHVKFSKLRIPFLAQTNFGHEHKRYAVGAHWGNAVCHLHAAPYTTVFDRLKEQEWTTSVAACNKNSARQAEFLRALRPTGTPKKQRIIHVQTRKRIVK
jgi:hypothetical protein